MTPWEKYFGKIRICLTQIRLINKNMIEDVINLYLVLISPIFFIPMGKHDISNRNVFKYIRECETRKRKRNVKNKGNEK